LVLAIAPKSVQPDATVLAFEMWIRSFTGQNNFGLGAALATILLVLLLPFLFINVRRLRTTGLGT
ncbi:MAG: sugar ABC transporter permease, partial [Gammaproteobacteria bacterium]|nr:sugar ABC transporter permease [Gammaproteobacteria bacterium]